MDFTGAGRNDALEVKIMSTSKKHWLVGLVVFVTVGFFQIAANATEKKK